MLTTFQRPHKASLLASTLLVLTLLQGTSFTLTIAMRADFGSSMLISLVTVAWLFMYLIAFVALLGSYGLNWLTWLVRYRLPLTCLVAGAAFSSAWSIDAGLSAERSVHLVGSTLLALYIGFSLPLTRLLKISCVVLGCLMAASLLVANFYPSLGIEDYEGRKVWSGVMASKNTLGFWASISVLLSTSLAFWFIPLWQRAVYVVLALLSGTCLYYSVSATSVLALLISGLVMVYLYTAFRLRLGLIATTVLGVLVALLAGMAFYYIDTAEIIGRSGDLTGRSDVWAQTWQLIMNKPLTGYGYGSIWYPTAASLWIQQSLTDFSWTVYHAHNGLLQIASELGLPLMALALFMVAQQLIEIVYCQYQRQQPGALFVLGFTVALLISNYSEARLLVNREMYWIFFIALPVSMLQQVTLIVSGKTYSPIPAKLPVPGRAKLDTARKNLAVKRELNRRLKKRRRIIMLNDDADIRITEQRKPVDRQDNADRGRNCE